MADTYTFSHWTCSWCGRPWSLDVTECAVCCERMPAPANWRTVSDSAWACLAHHAHPTAEEATRCDTANADGTFDRCNTTTPGTLTMLDETVTAMNRPIVWGCNAGHKHTHVTDAHQCNKAANDADTAWPKPLYGEYHKAWGCKRGHEHGEYADAHECNTATPGFLEAAKSAPVTFGTAPTTADPAALLNFIQRMQSEGVDSERVVARLRREFGGKVIPEA